MDSRNLLPDEKYCLIKIGFGLENIRPVHVRISHLLEQPSDVTPGNGKKMSFIAKSQFQFPFRKWIDAFSHIIGKIIFFCCQKS